MRPPAVTRSGARPRWPVTAPTSSPDAGIDAEVLEPAPGRGSCFARLPATVSDPEPPLVLLSHVDVVPVDAESWAHDPFGGELIDGVIWGRGAVDMKDMLAMELGCLLALHRSGAERRRDVILAAVADEEAGGEFGALHWVRNRPELFRDAAGRPAAAALNEVGGYPIHLGGRRFYTIQVAEKGIVWTRLRASGTPGHGSMPHADNPTVKLARAITRLADTPKPMRLTPVVRSFMATMGLDALVGAADRGSEEDVAAELAARVTDPVMRRSLDAMLRDTITPNVVHAGKKMNVIPGSGEAEVDVRTLPGTDQAAFLAHLQQVAGDEVDVSAVMTMPAVEVTDRRADRGRHARRTPSGRPGGHRGPDDDHPGDRREGARPARHPDLRLRPAAPRRRHAVPLALPRTRRARAGERASRSVCRCSPTSSGAS